MTAIPRYFSINADDLARAKAFYEAVFGWSIEAGPWDGYLQVSIGGIPSGAISARRELAPGQRTNAFVVTFGVENIHATLAAVERLGGTVLMAPSAVGDGGMLVGYFLDPDGTICGVGQYGAPGATPPALRFFAITADDLPRAKAFYAEVFGWAYETWGMPGFSLISNPGRTGALHDRKELIEGVRLNAIETTFAVADIAHVVAAVNATGGRIVIQPHRLEGVGEIGYFEDTEGNVCGFGLYDA